MFLISMLVALVAFVAFPESHDAILGNEKKDFISIETSGSLGIYYSGKCHKTYGNETIVSNEYSEWCSNIAKDKNDPKQNPWIQYSIKGKQMKVSKYSVRNGCCHYFCCCEEENGKIEDYGCCCNLYSYSLHGSNDNKTWKVIHKVEKNRDFDYCGIKTYDLEHITEPFTYLKFQQDEEWPYCPKCMQINQIEFYGETVSNGFIQAPDGMDDDESISIIGRVKKSEQ